MMKFPRMQTTTSSPVLRSTRKLTLSFAQDMRERRAERSSSHIPHASNVKTSSKQRRSYVSYTKIPTSDTPASGIQASTESSDLHLDAAWWIPQALDELSDTLKNKNSDYKVTSSEFSNFHFAADIAGLPVQDVMLAQIGIKLGRLRGLLDRNKQGADAPNYESIEDTIKDLAGYAVILYAYQLSLEVAR